MTNKLCDTYTLTDPLLGIERIETKEARFRAKAIEVWDENMNIYV